MKPITESHKKRLLAIGFLKIKKNKANPEIRNNRLRGSIKN